MDFIREKYEIEVFGLTPRECYLLIVIFNGTLLPKFSTISGQLLNAEVLAYAYESTLDKEKFGFDLGIIKNDTPELHYEFHDLAEKLATMSTEHSIAIMFFIFGFWAGISAARNGE